MRHCQARFRNQITLAGIVFCFTSLVGCSTVQSTLGDFGRDGASNSTRAYPTISNTVKQGCLGGAIAGVVFNAASTINDSTDRSFSDKIKDLGRDVAVGTGIGCTLAVALDNRRKNSASTAEYIDNEITVTRNLNRQTANVNAHLNDRIAANKVLYASLLEKKESSLLTADAVRDARRTSREDLAWARMQLETAEINLDAQKAAVSDDFAQAVDESSIKRLNDEVGSLEAHVEALEREIIDLSSINDAIGQLPA